VLRRAWYRTERLLTDRLPVGVLAAVLTAIIIWLLIQADVGPGLAAILGAAGGLVVLGLLVFGWHLVRYRSGWRLDEKWEPRFGGAVDGDGRLGFQLHAKSAYAIVADLRTMECVVQSPTGKVTTMANGDIRPGRGMLSCFCPKDGAGVYNVRWYGSTPGQKYYEITRQSVEWKPPT
jgi:hypothetical protein